MHLMQWIVLVDYDVDVHEYIRQLRVEVWLLDL